MSKIAQLSVVLLFINFLSLAQASDTTYWKRGGQSMVTFSQVSLTNWAAGGDNSISLTGHVNLFANYAKGKNQWNNRLVLGYGLIRQGDVSFRKTDDRINLITEYGRQINGEKFFWSSMIDFRTQFDRGLNAEGTLISKFMSPGYLMLASGLNWKPSEHFFLSYSPASGKFTFVMNQELADKGAFGVDAAELDAQGNVITPGKNLRSELGSFLKLNYKKEIFTNVAVEGRVELFANYLEKFGNIDVNLENALTMKVNDWLTVNWIVQLLYDDDIKIDQFDANDMLIGSGPRTQFRSVFGVGFAYNFGAQKKK